MEGYIKCRVYESARAFKIDPLFRKIKRIQREKTILIVRPQDRRLLHFLSAVKVNYRLFSRRFHSLRHNREIIISASVGTTIVVCILNYSLHLLESVIVVHIIGQNLKWRCFGLLLLMFGLMYRQSVGLRESSMILLRDQINQKLFQSFLFVHAIPLQCKD